MPEADGHHATREIWGLEGTMRRTPVIAMTTGSPRDPSNAALQP